jgi:hypothetical protein
VTPLKWLLRGLMVLDAEPHLFSLHRLWGTCQRNVPRVRCDIVLSLSAIAYDDRVARRQFGSAFEAWRSRSRC